MMAEPGTTLVYNATLFDGVSEQLRFSASLLIEGGRIVSVLEGDAAASEALRQNGDVQRIDLQNRFLMPGLIDAHFHSRSHTLDLRKLDEDWPSYANLHAGKLLNETLLRGFTTVRDTGGADIGLVNAIKEKLIVAPRLFISGRPLSQTGGHGDARPADRIIGCDCAQNSSSVVVVDGEEAVRKAAREELRRGADFLKIFVSGGVISPTDPIWMRQFTEREIRAVVDEAATRRTYVAAHAHTAEAARRCVEYGVRTIEHGTLIDRNTAQFIADSGAYVVPTLAIMGAMLGEVDNMPPNIAEKVRAVSGQALEALSHCSEAGVRLGFGTDLFGHLHGVENSEFELRARVNSPFEILRSATGINAEILQREDELGVIREGAYADLLVVDGNPFEDISLMADPEKNFLIIMKEGELIRNLITVPEQSLCG